MAGYLGNVPVPQATQTRDRFVATSGQTTFATSGYTVGYLDVYLNGVKLDSTDYTATNGSDVVLAIGASADDVVEVVAYSTFEVLNQTFSGDTQINGFLTVSDSDDAVIKVTTSGGNVSRISLDNTNTGGRDYTLSSWSNANGSAFSIVDEDAGVERLRISPTGNVGIGTSSPSSKLHVNNGFLQVDQGGTHAVRLGSTDQIVGGTDNEGVIQTNSNKGLRVFAGASERMRIDSAGRVTMPYQPSFKAYTSGGQINNFSGVLVFNDTAYAGGHNVGNHYNTSNGRFTAPVAGRYLFSAAMLMNPAFSGNTFVNIHWRINGTALHYLAHNHNQNWVMESAAVILNLNSGDYVDLYMYSGSGHYGTYSHFSGCLLG